MKIHEILNDTNNEQNSQQSPNSLVSQNYVTSPPAMMEDSDRLQSGLQDRERDHQARSVVGRSMMTGELKRAPSFTAPSAISNNFKVKAPASASSSTNLSPESEIQQNIKQEMSDPYNQNMQYQLQQQQQSHPNAIPSVLPPVPQLQTARVRLRTDSVDQSHIPQKRARRNTADVSAHLQPEQPDRPQTPLSAQTPPPWDGYPNPNLPANQRGRLALDATMAIDQHGNPIDGGASSGSSWSRQAPIPQLPPPPNRSSTAGAAATFALPNVPRDSLNKGNSIYPEPTMASISSAGSSAWHSTNGGSYMTFPSSTTQDDVLATPKTAPLPPPPALRKPSYSMGASQKIVGPPPAFRRRNTSASELLDHPQIRVALQKHKDLSWRALQEQIGGSWEPKSEVKVMLGEGAPGSLMKRYSASEILDPNNWGRNSRDNESSEAPTPQRVWFQIRPPMKGADEVKTFHNPDHDRSDTPAQDLTEDESTTDPQAQRSSSHLGPDKLISASKELMIKQLFPKYNPYIPGLPSGAIYLRQDHDRFEFRPYGWGRKESDSSGTESFDIGASSDPSTLALVRTPSGTPGGRYIAPNHRRLLQWSLAQSRWIFVLNELPTIERPRQAGGYSAPDRINGFLQQGEIVRRLDIEEDDDTENPKWEWILPVKSKLWVGPMEEIVRKCGPLAAPVWDLGGCMLWDDVAGQWRFEVCPATQEIQEVIKDKDGIDRAVFYDVCVGGRPRVSWDEFRSAHDYLLILQRKIIKLKARARERNTLRKTESSSSLSLFPETAKIKKEEDLESNFSDSIGDHESGIFPAESALSTTSSIASLGSAASVASTPSAAPKERKHKSLTDHGQHCAATLLNMMMSVGQVPPTATAAASRNRGIGAQINEDDVKNQNNAMDLDLGAAPAIVEPVPPVIEGGGFGRISSLSPSLSPTASKRSLSMEPPEEQKEPTGPAEDA